MLNLLNFLFSIGVNASSKVLPAYLVSRGLSAKAISSIAACYAVSRGIAPPLLGRPLDRAPRFVLLFAALVATAIIAVLASLSTEVAYLSIIFAVYGISTTVFYMTINSVATISHSKQKARALARLEVVYQLGFVVGTAGAATLSVVFGYRSIFVFWCATASIGAVVVLAVTKGKTRARSDSLPSSVRDVARQLRTGFGTFAAGITTIGFC